MRRGLTGLAICLAACGGHTAPNRATRAAGSRNRPAGRRLPVQPPPPAPAPVAISLPTDSAVSSPAKAARDSAADALRSIRWTGAHPAASLPEVPIESKATWDLNVASFADQPRVKYYLDYFTGRAHDRFQVWLQRMGRYESYARAQFAARKLPGDFVYLALIESGFSPEAVSRARAVGMWQFMLGTGKVYGLRVDTWLDERRDPIKSTDAAAHYLDDLSQRFGSHYLAAAAYNAGAGRVGRGLGQHVGHGGSSDDDDTVDVTSDDAFFSLADTRTIRDETKNYVPQLIAAAIIAKEPAKYGFDVAEPRRAVLARFGDGRRRHRARPDRSPGRHVAGCDARPESAPAAPDHAAGPALPGARAHRHRRARRVGVRGDWRRMSGAPSPRTR